MPVPDGPSWPEAGGTARGVHHRPRRRSSPRPACVAGEHLLVHGAAGGVGTAAVQLGRAAGARVTATVRNEALRDQVAALGAKVIAPDGFADHGPFDVILELVGAINLMATSRPYTGGRITVIGTGAGASGEKPWLC